MQSGIAELAAVSLDCPDPPALAAFYAALTGGKITHDAPEASAVVLPDGTRLILLRVLDYLPPTWPDGERPQQFHLDFDVDDLDGAEAVVRELGGAKPAFQPNPERWRVMTDPAGHPFCLCPRRR
ncbi:VOC family protein [Actinomadura kijaniata]|uniref:Putative enzyme related to lactoylglutathione lyase n=1 Tax=Actinomadura namibiensis TaxID=182080 RepID=A0A7W3QP58_ACTNM|nr:VOC family protein [Actinomadura namibiensis]MBA8953788.1 putative enzyme related to lactoylglutathione lyase [Actinomadura namibiensis]